MEYFGETLKTGQAKCYMFWLAKIFGRKTITQDEGYIFTFYTYRGKCYLINFEQSRFKLDR